MIYLWRLGFDQALTGVVNEPEDNTAGDASFGPIIE